ncbi:bidirectional sugar transporter SWEET1-like isoform X2 [Mangifera indica]|uniref:bidirectional sugar transporter SWEET1-like isoform X2 n=1 Tax=Mangifera indica TaxID=29780 RepID=UPI001CFBA5DC|nr:bidirectional sugar transporter SWEET1-like isoform X2 [Mangifera indica]
MHIAHFIFGIFGNAAALFLFLAPAITFKRIIRSKSTEQFSGIPYVMTMLNCLLSAWYGLPFISEDNLLVSTINGAALVSLLALHGNARKNFCGFAATIFSVIMYASPLSVIRMVIKTKSVEFMPFFLSLFVFLCGTSFFVYGLVGKDPFVAVPNGFGCGLGAVQLILYFIYHKKEDEQKKPEAANVCVEMSQETKAAVNGAKVEEV